MNAILPSNEHDRLAAVRRYEILDTPADGSFDHITSMAARLFQAPISIISIVDTDRIWFKSHHGLDVQQIPREPGLCASAILGNTPYLVANALTDPRTLTNPLVAGDFGLRFYLAVPLETRDGFNLGTLCVIDHEARVVTDEQIEDLRGLAALVVDQLELRLSARSAISELSGMLHQREILAREIDHRVMNSLQFVSGMLGMQGRGAMNTETSSQLEIASQRVMAVARVHRHFYLDAEVESTCGLEYMKRLVADLASVVAVAEVSVSGDPTPIPTTLVMPLGLVVNELVTNAGKYESHRINVDVRPAQSGATISVSDDGPGLPEDFDPAAGAGLGMRVIQSLVRQHNGEMTFGRGENGGALFTVTLRP